MNLEDYQVMINEVVESLSMQAFDAAERNQYKDKRGPPFNEAFYVKGWEGFDLREKLKEEVAEVLENPTPQELGDVAWVIAMMLDQVHSKGASP